MAPKRSPPRVHMDASAMRDSPVFQFHTARAGDAYDHDYGLTYPTQTTTSTRRNSNAAPWKADEHERFLEGLEKHACGQSASVFATWHAITAMVGTRSVADVKAHAGHYYAQLQQVNAQKRKEYLAMQLIDSRWTMHEDTQLEDELARHQPTVASINYPWEKIARCVQGKTPRDARERYKKLCYDVARIESGQQVTMNLGRGGSRHQPNENGMGDADSQSIDCAVTLTPQETKMLLHALEQVPVPSQASAQVLAAVASAVTALACVKYRKPPRRVVPLFSVGEAQRALRRAIEDELDDPLDVLEVLATELCLVPPPPTPAPVSRHPKTSHASDSNHRDFHGKRSATVAPISTSADFSFGCLSPSEPLRNPSELPYYQSCSAQYAEKEETRSAEELLNLRTSPVHASHRDEMARTVQRYRRLDDFSSGGGSGGCWPYSFQTASSPPVSSAHARSNANSYDLDTSYHHRYRSSSSAPDSMDDFMY